MQCLKEGFITRGIDEPGFTSTHENVHNTFLGETFIILSNMMELNGRHGGINSEQDRESEIFHIYDGV